MLLISYLLAMLNYKRVKQRVKHSYLKAYSFYLYVEELIFSHIFNVDFLYKPLSYLMLENL